MGRKSIFHDVMSRENAENVRHLFLSQCLIISLLLFFFLFHPEIFRFFFQKFLMIFPENFREFVLQVFRIFPRFFQRICRYFSPSFSQFSEIFPNFLRFSRIFPSFFGNINELGKCGKCTFFSEIFQKKIRNFPKIFQIIFGNFPKICSSSFSYICIRKFLVGKCLQMIFHFPQDFPKCKNGVKTPLFRFLRFSEIFPENFRALSGKFFFEFFGHSQNFFCIS